jgi:hypothetical protein
VWAECYLLLLVLSFAHTQSAKTTMTLESRHVSVSYVVKAGTWAVGKHYKVETPYGGRCVIRTLRMTMNTYTEEFCAGCERILLPEHTTVMSDELDGTTVSITVYVCPTCSGDKRCEKDTLAPPPLRITTRPPSYPQVQEEQLEALWNDNGS